VYHPLNCSFQKLDGYDEEQFSFPVLGFLHAHCESTGMQSTLKISTLCHEDYFSAEEFMESHAVFSKPSTVDKKSLKQVLIRKQTAEINSKKD